MPQKPETKFYQKVNAGIPREVYRLKMSNPYSNGIPDFWYSGSKADGWVEYKWLPKLSRADVDPRHTLSTLQLLWINGRWREGRLVLVVIGSPQGCAILSNGEWNESVLSSRFCLSIFDISLKLSGLFYDLSVSAGAHCISN